jgi:para-nitrobenzyl esterase
LKSKMLINACKPLMIICLGLLASCGPEDVDHQPDQTVEYLGPTFETQNAIYQGRALLEPGSGTRAVDAFLGIPFAQAPVGNLRWAAPQVLPSVQSKPTVMAQMFAPACMQGPHISNWYKGVIESFGADASSFPTPEVSEDCLYLNIWRPSKFSDDPLPVMVFIHGGSNKGGWSYEPNYIGQQMASQGAVVVSVAYRLGVFGFFSHPELAAANFALLDQIAALRWIQDNISALGGDADNVTLFGESAGASNIAYLMAAPPASDLFARAIHQSGGWAMYRTQAKKAMETLGVELTDAVAHGQNASIEVARSASSEQVLATAEVIFDGHFFDPVIDGDTVTKPLQRAASLGELADVDLMIGTNANESRMYLPEGATIESWLEKNGSDQSKDVSVEALLGVLVETKERDSLERLDQLATSVSYTCPSFSLAQANADTGNQTWFYHFTKQRDGALGAQMGAYHGAELPYVFNTHDEWLPTSEQDHRLTKSVMRYWLNFAKTGNPNSSALTHWEPYTKAGDPVQFLGVTLKSAAHPSAKLCQLLENKS